MEFELFGNLIVSQEKYSYVQKPICYNSSMTFSQFCQYLYQLEETSSRLDMTEQLAELFSQLSQSEIPPACYLMQGNLVPRYKTLEFNMSTKLTMRALARLLAAADQSDQLPDTNLFNEKDYSLFQEKIEKKYKQKGDLGLAAEELISKSLMTNDSGDSDQQKTDQQKTTIASQSEQGDRTGQQSDYQPLTITQVFQKLKQIAQEEGEGSQDRKISQSYELFARLQPLSVRYVVRIIIGKLRLGFSTMTMIDALSWAQHQSKQDRNKIEKAYDKKADIGKLAQGYLICKNQSEIEQFLASYEVEVDIPVVPALCQRLNSAQEIIDKMGRVVAEPKYDGLRAQIHIDKSNKNQPYQVFTRNMDNMTHMFPELKETLGLIAAQSCILDAEAIAYDPDSGELLSFQQTITRKRKHGVKSKAEQTPIKFYVFDLLLANDDSLVEKPLLERKQRLAELISDNSVLELTEFVVTDDAKQLKQYHEKQLSLGREGAVIKQIDSPYRGGRKGWRWVKIKESEGTQGKLNDTLDCVVMGYYRGKGKRSEFGIGAFLVGVRATEEEKDAGLTEQVTPVAGSKNVADSDGDSETETVKTETIVEKPIKTIAKIGTGLTDDQFKRIKGMADDVRVDAQPDQYDVPDELAPDVWIYPEIVVEIAADELTNSPLHTAGRALRFPRLVKFRQDKDWEDVTTLSELKNIG